MPSAIVCSVPAFGHVRPMLAVASALKARGWRVRFVTGTPFEADVTAIGVEFVPLTPEYDEVLTPPASGRESMNHLKEVFFDAVPAQVDLLRRMLDDEPADAVFAELTFLGIRALLSRVDRPLLVSCCVFPLIISSRDTAPFGPGLPPLTTAGQRRRYRAMTALMKRVALRPVHKAVDQLYREIGAPERGGRFFTDVIVDFDVLAEFSVQDFEYPRSDAPDNLRFYGPPAPSLPSSALLPDWWGRLDGRPIVHVTQGTSFNDDYERLIAPTVRALAHEQVQVVVATGGRPVTSLPPLPANAFAAEFLPYDRLLPLTDVLVTNGGFGTVLEALGRGVPIVAGSGFGDQVETAARIAWSGVGIDLGKRVPSERAIADAVGRVLADPTFRESAAGLAAEIQASPGAAGLVADVESLIAARLPQTS